MQTVHSFHLRCDIGVIIESPDILQSSQCRLLIQRLSLEATHVTIANCLETDSLWHR